MVAMQELPLVSVVVPVRNEEKFISRTLTQIVEQDYPRDKLEILVVDGMSEDGTEEIVKEIAKQYQFVKLLENPQRLSSSGRNIGVRNSKGDILIFIDGHCYIPSGLFLRGMVDIFEKTQAFCLCRPAPPNPPDISSFQSAVALARNSFLGHGLDSTIYTQKEGWVDPVSSGAIYKREIFEKVGCFDESFDACEDVEFNFRIREAGLRGYTSPELTILYYPRDNLRGLFRQMWRYGQGRLKFMRKHKNAISLGQLIPSIFIALLPFLFVVGLFKMYFIDVFFLLLCCYVLAVFYFSLRLSTEHGWKYILHLPWIYFVIHFGLGLGFIGGFFKRS